MATSRRPIIRINDAGLRRFARDFEGQLRRGQAGPIRDMYTGWGVRYLDFVKREFVKNSEGGGEWPALSPATLARRRNGQAPKIRTAKTTGKADRQFKRRVVSTSAKILRDTGTLLAALSVGAKGNLFRQEQAGIRVGFDRGQSHSSAGVSIGELAKWHNTGEGRLPQRAILVPPDEQTRRGMLLIGKNQVMKLMAASAISTRPRRRR